MAQLYEAEITCSNELCHDFDFVSLVNIFTTVQSGYRYGKNRWSLRSRDIALDLGGTQADRSSARRDDMLVYESKAQAQAKRAHMCYEYLLGPQLLKQRFDLIFPSRGGTGRLALGSPSGDRTSGVSAASAWPFQPWQQLLQSSSGPFCSRLFGRVRMLKESTLQVGHLRLPTWASFTQLHRNIQNRCKTDGSHACVTEFASLALLRLLCEARCLELLPS